MQILALFTLRDFSENQVLYLGILRWNESSVFVLHNFYKFRILFYLLITWFFTHAKILNFFLKIENQNYQKALKISTRFDSISLLGEMKSVSFYC